MSDVRLPSGVVYRDDHDGLRERLVGYCNRLLDDGLAIGSAGNMSVRAGDEVLITPSGIPYREMNAGDICVIGMDGTQHSGAAEPSSETPMHLAVYAAAPAGAVVHTHSPEVIALSAVCDELPAIHYAITGLGGPVRVAGYTRFGSEGLAEAATAALDAAAPRSCRTTARSPTAPASARRTTGRCCWSGWRRCTGWRAPAGSRGS